MIIYFKKLNQQKKHSLQQYLLFLTLMIFIQLASFTKYCETDLYLFGSTGSRKDAKMIDVKLHVES